MKETKGEIVTREGRVRRSWLVVPAHDAELLQRAIDGQPDVLVLDLEYSVPPKYRETVRSSLPDISRAATRFGGDVFVRVNWSTRWCDVRAAVCPDLRGFVVPGPNDPGEIEDLDRHIGDCEKRQGVIPGRIELALILESPQGFRNAFALANASPRVTTVGLGRIDLTMDLGLDPEGEFRLYPYLMSRVVTVAAACKKQAIGAHWREGSRGGVAIAEKSFEAAQRARWSGFSGGLCVDVEQATAMSAGFTPSEEELKQATDAITALRTTSSTGPVFGAVEGRYYDGSKVGQCVNMVAYAQDCAEADESKTARASARRGN